MVFVKILYVFFVCSVCESQKKPFYLRKTSLPVRQAGKCLEFVQRSVDCLKGKHYFEDNCKNFTDFYMSFIAGAACMYSAFSGNTS